MEPIPDTIIVQQILWLYGETLGKEMTMVILINYHGIKLTPGKLLYAWIKASFNFQQRTSVFCRWRLTQQAKVCRIENVECWALNGSYIPHNPSKG